jgi:UDP-N-acetylglucosamine 2-epimerase (non-hydrolysing)
MNNRIKITFVIGTRPEVIKLAPVILESRRRGHSTRVVFTGQHRHMVKPLLDFFGIEPDFDLDVMAPDQTLTSLSSRILNKLDQTTAMLASDFIVVQGDTTSAFTASYWSFCHRIPVVHIEAGLRTGLLGSPFPEEGNRQLISRIARLHFAPTRQAAETLLKEQIDSNKIFQVGNTAIDSLNFVLDRLKTGGISDDLRLSSEFLNFVGNLNSSW